MHLKTLQIIWHGKEPVFSVDFQPNSHTLVSGGQDGEIKVPVDGCSAYHSALLQRESTSRARGMFTRRAHRIALHSRAQRDRGPLSARATLRQTPSPCLPFLKLVTAPPTPNLNPSSFIPTPYRPFHFALPAALGGVAGRGRQPFGPLPVVRPRQLKVRQLRALLPSWWVLYTARHAGLRWCTCMLLYVW